MDVKELVTELVQENQSLKFVIDDKDASIKRLKKTNDDNQAELRGAQEDMAAVVKRANEEIAKNNTNIEEIHRLTEELEELKSQNLKVSSEEFENLKKNLDRAYTQFDKLKKVLSKLKFPENINFKQLREDFRLSQAEMGKVAGIEQRTVSSLENDPGYLKKMSVERAFQVLRAYKVIQ